MDDEKLLDLSRRERQIMDIIFRDKAATAAEIRESLPDKISDSGVRTLLRVLVKKGLLEYREKGLKYVYTSTVPLARARFSAIQHLKETFFGNSVEKVVSALLDTDKLTTNELEKLEKIIAKAKKEGK